MNSINPHPELENNNVFAVNGGGDAPKLVERRRSQVDMVKKTEAYEKYSESVGKEERTLDMPRTPEITQNVSTRAFDLQVRFWRQSVKAWARSEACGDLFPPFGRQL
jgi:hypothetical protein